MVEYIYIYIDKAQPLQKYFYYLTATTGPIPIFTSENLVGEKMLSQDEFKRCHELVQHYDYLLTLLKLRETSSGVNTTCLLSSILVIFI